MKIKFSYPSILQIHLNLGLWEQNKRLPSRLLAADRERSNKPIFSKRIQLINP